MPALFIFLIFFMHINKAYCQIPCLLVYLKTGLSKRQAIQHGELAQLARAVGSQSTGRGFESRILHFSLCLLFDYRYREY